MTNRELLNVKDHTIAVPPAHYDSILNRTLKFYLVEEDKDNPYNVGDFLSFLCCCGPFPTDAIECNHKITYKMKICKILCFYMEHWDELKDWYVIGFEEAPAEEIKEYMEHTNNCEGKNND